MSTANYLLGWLVLAAAIAPLAWAAYRLRHRYWPGFEGAVALLADAVVVLAALLLAAEATGTIGIFHAPTLVAMCVAAAAFGGLLAGPPGSTSSAVEHARRRPISISVLAAGGAVALATFAQLPETFAALDGGISNFDSLEYHLSAAARWVQDASLAGRHHVFPDALFPYYPSNSELVHAVAMLAFGRDVLSPVINLGFVALAFLAAWSIGSMRGAGPAAVAALGAVLATVHFSYDGGGTALSDIPQTALVLAAIALLAAGRQGPGELAIAALAAGLAAGTKPIAAFPVAALALGAVVAAPAERRTRSAAAVAIGLLVGGGFWYLRNLVWIGTPIPGRDLGPLPTPRAVLFEGTTFGDAVRAGTDPIDALADAFSGAFGPAWIALAALAVAGLVAALGPGRAAWEHTAAAAGLANVLSFPFLPFTAIVPFAVRYLLPAFAIGLVLVACSPRAATGRARILMPWAFTALAAAGLAHLGPSTAAYRDAAAVGALLAGGTVVAAVALRSSARATAAALTVAVALVVGKPIADHYLAVRYEAREFVYRGFEAEAAESLFAWGRSVSDARIGVEGAELQYPLYGSDLSNHVQYIGRPLRDGGFTRIDSCPAWRRAINAGDYDFVVTVPWGSQSRSRRLPSPHGEWTAGDPAARPVLEPRPGVTVFEITGHLDPAACADARRVDVHPTPFDELR